MARKNNPETRKNDSKASANITTTKKVRRLAAVLLPLPSAVFHADGNFPGQSYGKEWKTEP